MLIVLSSLSNELYYIPNAALAAIIYIAIANLIHFGFFWESWKLSKKDFLTGFVTWIFTWVYNTEIGLAAGIGTSIGVYCVIDIILSKSHNPRLFSSSRENGDIDVVRVESDLNFLNAYRVKDFIVALTFQRDPMPEVTNKSEFIRFKIAEALDSVLRPQLPAGVEKLPKAIVVDLCIVKTVDFSGMKALKEAFASVRKTGVLVALINVNPDVVVELQKWGIKSDKSTADVNFEEFEKEYSVDLWTIQSRPKPRGHSRTEEELAGFQDTKNFSEIEMKNVTDVSVHHQPHHKL